MCQNTTAWWILDTTQFQHVLQIIASCKILSLYGKLLTSKKKKKKTPNKKLRTCTCNLIQVPIFEKTDL